MSETPKQRREQILLWLRESQTLSIEELVLRLGVSAMTVHRDLDLMAKDGLVQKSYGRVALVTTKAETHPPVTTCAVCHADVPYRTTFTLHLRDGQCLNACCPHCGLLLLNMNTQVVSALTRDFIYGRMVNVMQAVYVLESRVQLCCVPSILCFASQHDAENFVRGFGGTVMDFAQVSAVTGHQHHPMTHDM